MKQHRLVKQAIDAVNELFGDSSVPRHVTRERLKEVRDEIDSNLAALDEDDRNENRE